MLMKSIYKQNISNFIKKFIYKIISLFNIFPIEDNKIVFINGHSSNIEGNIKVISEEVMKDYPNYKVIIYYKDDVEFKLKHIFKYIRTSYNILTAKFIILNDYVSLFSNVKVRKNCKMIQVWHAGGAFKRFGIDSLQNINNINNMKKCIACHSQYDKVIVSSRIVKKIYANAFSINESKIYPLGLARADKFYDERFINETKKNFLEKYSNLKNKKIILYAPTYRDGQIKEFNLKLDLEYLYRNLSSGYVIVTKLHPFIKNGIDIPLGLSDRILNLSHEDIDELMISSDLLITDYSSIIFEYAIMEKPIIFFAYDLQEYNNNLRGFYYSYEEFVPGIIVKNTKEIVNIITKDVWDYKNIRKFKNKFNEYNDGKATKRIVENILQDI
ncbi:CDP-glycerol--glycerophosphate glycerophosphotransferase [Clostridium botulinum]|nr:CDP-glycerol--glycerophosphate glycerophosphotransferase [Clostridium botulinum]